MHSVKSKRYVKFSVIHTNYPADMGLQNMPLQKKYMDVIIGNELANENITQIKHPVFLSILQLLTQFTFTTAA